MTDILETALYVDDLDAAEAFYAGALGLPVISRHPTRQLFLRCGAGVLLIFNATETRKPPISGALPVPPHGTTGAGHMCFGADADALDGWHDRLVAAGIKIEADFHWPNGARSIYVRDPAGNSIEFADRTLWSPQAS